jgi:hypothetical protein
MGRDESFAIPMGSAGRQDRRTRGRPPTLGDAILDRIVQTPTDRTGLHRASLCSVLQRAFPTRPHGARPDCLATPHLRAVAGLRLLPTLLRRELAPPIQGPCLAHQGCSPRSHRLRRLNPLNLTPSPAVHSVMSFVHCCTSDLKRRPQTRPLRALRR